MRNITIVIIAIALLKWYFTDPSITVPTNDISFNYIVKHTQNSDSGDTLPMLVALHGNGDSTQNFYETALDKLNVPLRIVLLEGPISMGSGYRWPSGVDEHSKYAKAINEAVELLASKYSTKQKPILLGFSGGGMMAYYQAANYANSYSYIFPISGNLSGNLQTSNLAGSTTKVFAYHGSNDRVVSASGGRNAVKILESQGMDVNYTEFNGNHHGIYTSMKTEITNTLEEKILSLN